ncbi:hypothetical protein B0H13DRAFT_2538519 [Mycena leptocephala]|nr:hypothetical protein B0H13DRAFT_2538519 [Mycena leptocephala]
MPCPGSGFAYCVGDAKLENDQVDDVSKPVSGKAMCRALRYVSAFLKLDSGPCSHVAPRPGVSTRWRPATSAYNLRPALPTFLFSLRFYHPDADTGVCAVGPMGSTRAGRSTPGRFRRLGTTLVRFRFGGNLAGWSLFRLWTGAAGAHTYGAGTSYRDGTTPSEDVIRMRGVRCIEDAQYSRDSAEQITSEPLERRHGPIAGTEPNSVTVDAHLARSLSCGINPRARILINDFRCSSVPRRSMYSIFLKFLALSSFRSRGASSILGKSHHTDPLMEFKMRRTLASQNMVEKCLVRGSGGKSYRSPGLSPNPPTRLVLRAWVGPEIPCDPSPLRPDPSLGIVARLDPNDTA